MSRGRLLRGKQALKLLPDECVRGRLAARKQENLPAPAGRHGQHAGQNRSGVLAAHRARARVRRCWALHMRCHLYPGGKKQFIYPSCVHGMCILKPFGWRRSSIFTWGSLEILQLRVIL